MAGAAKAVAGYENPLGRKARVGSSPSARTNFPLPSLRIRKDCGCLRQRGMAPSRVSRTNRAHIRRIMGNVQAKRFTSRWHLACVLLLSLPRFGVAQSSVREIAIRSGWGGLGTPQDQTIVIRAKNGTLVYNGKRVEQSKVEALIAALNAPPIPRPELSNLGATPAWLNEQIGDPKGRFRLEVARATASQRALLSDTIKNPQQVARVVPALFSYVRTDDYPGATVEVTFDDGAKLKVETHSYYPFMLPWTVGRTGRHTTQTFPGLLRTCSKRNLRTKTVWEARRWRMNS